MTRQAFWIRGTLLLTIAGFLSKILGMIYRVPLQNIAGDEGLYVYQQIYPILSVALMLSIYSFPGAVVHVISENRTDNHIIRKRDQSIILLLFLLFGITIFIFLYSFANEIASWMGDYSLSPAIRTSSIMFLLIPFTSFLRGIFQGIEKTEYVASSQILEQFIRVVFIILFTVYISTQQASIYDLGSFAALSTLIGTSIAVLFLTTIYTRFKRKGRFKLIHGETKKRIYKTVIVITIVYSLNYLLHLLLQFVDVFTMVNHLQRFGYTFEEAKEYKGMYDRSHAIIQLGLVFGSSLALALIPSIQNKRKNKIKPDERLAFKITFTLSLAASVGLIAIMPLFNPLLYENNNGTYAIQMMMILVFLLSMVILFSVFLQRYNYRLKQLYWITIMIVIKAALNMLLIPKYGIIGASVASVIAVLFLLFVFWIIWLWLSKEKIHFSFLVKVIFSSLFMGISIFSLAQWFMLNNLIESRLFLLVAVLLLCLIGVMIYLLLILWLKVFTKEEKHHLFNKKVNQL